MTSTPIDVSSFLLPESLQTEFWLALAEAFSTEIQNIKNYYGPQIAWEYYTRNILNSNYINDPTGTQQLEMFQNIAETFGADIDVSLTNSSTILAYFQREIKAIPFKIKRKTTYLSYQYIFNSIISNGFNGTGFVYNLFYDNFNLVRAIDTGTTGTNIASYNFLSPFLGTIPLYYYASLQNSVNTLDSGLFLDNATNPWYLDIRITRLSTHHLAIELVPSQLQTVNSVNYLMTEPYLDFLLRAANYTRKCTEVPHCGVQIALLTDQSRFYNNLNNTYPSYTVPALQANFAVTQNFSNSPDLFTMFAYIVAGTGNQPMFAYGSVPGNINSLANQVYMAPLSLGEVQNVSNFYMINARISNGQVQNYVLGHGDGSTTYFAGMLPTGNIIPETMTMQFTTSKVLTTVTDDGYGNLVDGSYFSGTVNYTTGLYSFNFFKTFTSSQELVSTGGTNVINKQLSNGNIKLNTFQFTYFLGGNSYLGICNSSGQVTGAGIVSGNLTGNGYLSVMFSQSTNVDNIFCNYTYLQYSTPDSGSKILVTYKTENNLPITELGILDVNSNLVAYATIPPCLLPNLPEYYLSPVLFIRNS